MELWKNTGLIFGVLVYLNLLNFIDRGIIPGSTNEFTNFIQGTQHSDMPDLYLGLLQSAFIIGFIVGAVIFGHLIHYVGRFYLTGIGSSIWFFALILSGLSRSSNSYVCLAFARALSGFGEAGLQCSVPPWIESSAPSGYSGTWLAVFFTAIPVGTALGYTYSALISSTLGWEWSFFIEALLSIPSILFLFVIAKHFPSENSSQPTMETCQPMLNSPVHKISFLEEVKIVITKPIFLCISLAGAAQTAALIGVSTFGSAFMLGLGYFDTEAESSTVFDILISIAGVVGTPIGGFLVDRLNRNLKDSLIIEQNHNPLTVNSTNYERNSMEDIELATISHDKYQPKSSFHPNKPYKLKLLKPNPSLITTISNKFYTTYSTEILLKLQNIINFLYWTNSIGTFILAMLYFMNEKFVFLFFTTIGCTLIFSTNSGITIAILLAVPEQNRSFAIAIFSIIGHLFGDVPSPILTGYMKDKLAPGCISSHNNNADDGSNTIVSASLQCRADSEGLRLTILFTFLWCTWCSVFVALAWYIIHRMKQDNKL